MKRLTGDLIELAKDGEFDVIVHGCNCFHRMGAGIAKAIRKAFPEAEEADLKTSLRDRSKLGSISWAEVELPGGSLVVVNAYTQYHYGGGKRRADCDAIRQAFREVKARFGDRRIGYPKIGAGLARGDWDTINQIIDEELEGTDHAVVELPEDHYPNGRH